MKTPSSNPKTEVSSLEALRELYQSHFRGHKLSRNENALYTATHDFLAGEGKRIRPLLCLMGCELFGGKPEDALGPAYAIELFHNFTLIHDDIMDQADLRRGRPTVHKQYGENTAILAGDLVLIHAYEYLGKADPGILPAILQVFNQTAIEVVEGQQDDLDFEDREEVEMEEYLQMIAFKTSVLLAASLRIGAMVAGAPEGQQELIYAFGKNLGLSFQIRDDFLDAFGSGGKTGKKVGGDILQNKKTYLHVAAWQAADPEQKETMRQLAEEPNADLKISKTLDLYEALGVRQQTEQEMRSFYESALDHLERIEVPAEQKIVLKDFAQQVFTRNR